MYKPKQDGLYLKAKVFDLEINCLLDTGSTSTIMHPKKFMSIPEHVRPTITKKCGNLRMADGGIVNSAGIVTIPFDVQGRIFNQRVIIANVEAPVVLGYDFLLQHQCSIEWTKAELTINDLHVQCLLESQMSSVFRIKLIEDVVVPPACEIIVPCKIDGDAPLFSNAIIEAEGSKLAKKGILIAKSVVDPCTGEVPLRLVNVNNQPQQLYKNTHAASCQPVDIIGGEYETNTISGNIGKVSGSSPTEPVLPEHLTCLI